jgi:hypothetical protein
MEEALENAVQLRFSSPPPLLLGRCFFEWPMKCKEKLIFIKRYAQTFGAGVYVESKKWFSFYIDDV